MWLWTLVWGTLVEEHFSATPVGLAGVSTYWKPTPRRFEPLRAEPNGIRSIPLAARAQCQLLAFNFVCTPAVLSTLDVGAVYSGLVLPGMLSADGADSKVTHVCSGASIAVRSGTPDYMVSGRPAAMNPNITMKFECVN